MRNKLTELLCLISLRKEIGNIKDIGRLAPESEYNHGYMKAMTNVLAIIDEQIRITEQDGDPTILSEQVELEQDGFKITINDGFCTWEYLLKPQQIDGLSIDTIIKYLFKKFKSPIDNGKLIE